MSLLKMAVCKGSVSERVCENMIYCNMFFCTTLIGLFIVGITPFLYTILRNLCTFLFVSCSSRFMLKSPATWNNLFDFFYFGEYVV